MLTRSILLNNHQDLTFEELKPRPRNSKTPNGTEAAEGPYLRQISKQEASKVHPLAVAHRTEAEHIHF
eukprot:8332152-Pyramimonas_sp.AAC.1